jgi:outer membrane protein TolC
MKRTTTILLLLLSLNAFAQQTLTLDECYSSARRSYPSLKQKPFNDSLSGNKLNNYDIGYLPKISFGAQASYQSDVTKLNINVPFIQMPDINKDRYQLTMDVKQLIYDGGNISSLKDIEKSSLQVDQQKIEVELYALKQRVNDLYFNVLISKEKRKSLDITASDISDRIAEQESKVKGGAIAEGNVYILKAQLLQVQSQMTEADNDILSAINSLSELTGEAIQPDADFAVPENKNVSTGKINYFSRPENQLYELQKNYLTSLKGNLHSSKNPKFSAFGQAGYGRPGLNMLDNTFQPYYIVGLNFSWSPIDWGSESLQSQIYDVNRSIVDIQRETFYKNLTVTEQRYKSDIEKYSALLNKDDEILSVRQDIMKVTLSQLDNGIITATNYVTELNNYNQAMLTKNIHRLQLIQSKINFLTNQGY